MPPRRSERSKRAPSTGGRPRIDPTCDTAVLSNDRRNQVRRAQKKYRQKKEAIFLNATARVDQLEARIRAAQKKANELCAISEQAQLCISHPEIYTRLHRLQEVLMDNDSITPTASGSPPETSDSSRDQIPIATLNVQGPTPTLASPVSTTEHSYAFQEVRFARRLQRFCLEYTYRIFTDPRSDPRKAYRVLRLVSCVRDPAKTQPRLRQLLMGGSQDPLELFGLPFYNVGGAGSHFPDVDENGEPVYPANRRMPGRILGISPNSKDCPKECGDTLELYGLGGEWFDCRDVEGYLKLHGVDVNEGLFPRVRIHNGCPEREGVKSYVLDVEGFFSSKFSEYGEYSYTNFSGLLSSLVILGRAPGFKKMDVRRALQSAMRKANHRAPSG